MPARNVIKQYIASGAYHIYNRGVDKRVIFEDSQDYNVFIYLMKRYLSKGETEKENFVNHIDLYAFCLMPNHFHLLLRQRDDDRAIARFVKCLITSYVLYFNKKHKRTGALFENRYKGILVKEDGYLFHLSRYIHLNPLSISLDPFEYSASSLKYYSGNEKVDWLKKEFLLRYFNKHYKKDLGNYHTYKDFLKY